MELTEKAVVVRPVPGGQAERAGVRPGWRLVGMQGQKLKSSQHLQDLLAHYKELNVSEAALTFLPEELPRPKPRQPAKAPVKAPRTPPSSVPPPRAGGGVDALDVASWTPKMKQGVAAAGCWFIVKFLFGPVVHQWLSTVLAFGFCAVVTSTVGFDPTMFFGGLATLIMVLRLLGFFLGQGVHDCIVLGLIAAYNTKPSSASFDGRPMREMQAAQAEIRQHQEAAARSVHRSEPQNFLEKILAKGREVVQDVVADVADANVCPLVHMAVEPPARRKTALPPCRKADLTSWYPCAPLRRSRSISTTIISSWLLRPRCPRSGWRTCFTLARSSDGSISTPSSPSGRSRWKHSVRLE